MARATSGGGEVFAEGDLGELSIGGAVVGWVRLHVSRGAVTWERDRWWRLSIDREQWLDIDEWTLDGLGRLRYDRLQGGPASAFDYMHRGEYQVLASQLPIEARASSNSDDEITVQLRWLRGDERIQALEELDRAQSEPPAQ
ncbi:hypothetical protein [Microbacterium sp. UBA3394]|uniref:hypothetical protein n=1 Tax=Microbacterium sp. UBA3394 TaxID=1946945 RepID=UPI0025809EEE|nr:hypothetical protein [Microbacterium sp. UBA3394]